MITLASTALVAAAPTLFRQGLVSLLRERWPQLLLTRTTDATEVVGLVLRRAFGLLVLDGGLPGLALPRLLAQLQEARPRQRLLVFAEPRTLPPTPRAWPGTQMLVSSRVTPQALAAALAPWLDAGPSSADLAPSARPTFAPAGATADGFSRRELEVLRLVVDDYCNQEIADQLCLSVRTVESHRRTLLQKAGTRTLVGLAARAVREGWVA